MDDFGSPVCSAEGEHTTQKGPDAQGGEESFLEMNASRKESEDDLENASKEELLLLARQSQHLINEYQVRVMDMERRFQEERQKNAQLSEALFEFKEFLRIKFPNEFQVSKPDEDGTHSTRSNSESKESNNNINGIDRSPRISGTFSEYCSSKRSRYVGRTASSDFSDPSLDQAFLKYELGTDDIHSACEESRFGVSCNCVVFQQYPEDGNESCYTAKEEHDPSDYVSIVSSLRSGSAGRRLGRQCFVESGSLMRIPDEIACLRLKRVDM